MPAKFTGNYLPSVPLPSSQVTLQPQITGGGGKGAQRWMHSTSTNVLYTRAVYSYVNVLVFFFFKLNCFLFVLFPIISFKMNKVWRATLKIFFPIRFVSVNQLCSFQTLAEPCLGNSLYLLEWDLNVDISFKRVKNESFVYHKMIPTLRMCPSK